MLTRLLDFFPKLRLLRRRVAVDLRSNAVCWAESRWTWRGFELVASGREEAIAGEPPQAVLGRLAKSRRFRTAEVIVAVRHPELRLQRLELPGIAKSEVRSLGLRRAAALAAEMPEEANATFAMAPGRSSRGLWLVACPEAFAEFTDGQWQSLGLEIGRLQSVHLSLGSLARKLAPPKTGELRGFFDVGDGQATCVVADAEGWIFSRDIGFKAADAGAPDSDSEEVAAEPFERLATELRRTLHYVESELRLGIVSELYVSGDMSDPNELIDNIVAQVPIDVQVLTEALEYPALEDLQPSLGIALGLAQAASLEGGNLLGSVSLRDRSSESLHARLVLACAVLGAAVLLGGTWIGLSLKSLKGEAARADETWQELRDARRDASVAIEARKRAATLAEVAGRFDAATPPFAHAIQSIGMLLPDDAVLHKLSTSREGARWKAALEVEFRGASMAEAADDAGRFRTALGSSLIWRVRNVTQRRNVPRPLGDDGAVRMNFDLDAELRSTEPVSIGTRPRAKEQRLHG